MSYTADKLFNLLPEIYRIRDEERGGPLRIILEVIAEQVSIVEEDIAGLHDNWFVETADDWVVPYLGDLLGVWDLYQLGEARLDTRARVANTLAYRRRKGTATMLEQLARDTTLWNARAVEFFQLLATTQHLNHVRHENVHTPDLRNVDRLQLLETPFDTIAHTADVRHIDTNRGRHNIPNVGIFLWRLQSYPIELSDARRIGGVAEGRYTFSPLGNPAPLFNAPEAESEITHLAEEANVPTPIRPLAFYLDLREYRESFLSAPPNERSAITKFYGPGRSLEVLRDGTPVPPIDLICADLRDWQRPPAGVSGVLSSDLAVPPGLTSTTPQMLVSVGTDGPHTVTLTAQPTDLESARDLLERAIRDASPGPGFRAARVLTVGGGLLVLPGRPGESLTFAPAPGDADTIARLGFAESETVRGLLSRPLRPFPSLIAGSFDITIGSTGPRTATLTAAPGGLGDVQSLLQAAIRAADTAPCFADAEVLLVNEQVLVLPGTPGEAMRIEPSATDHLTAELLRLTNKVAVDVRLGRLAFSVGDEPQSVQVSYNYGFSSDLAGGPYDRIPSDGTSNTLTEPESLDLLVNVPADAATPAEALTAWGLAGRPNAVIQIADSRTYGGSLTIAMSDGDLVLQAQNGQRPAIIGDVIVTNGAFGARLTLDGLLISGRLHIQGKLDALTLRHCTLAPGHTLDAQGQSQAPAQPSLVVAEPNAELGVVLDHCITGPVRLPETVAALEIVDSIVESSYRGGQARVIPALVSGRLSTFTPPSSSSPHVSVSIGGVGPLVVTLSGVPNTLAAARDMLQAGIRAAAPGSPAFSGARVLSAEDRLIVLGGIPGKVTIEPHE
ncbi:MAG: hypothetical protein M3P51_11145, partial [Chloroflexota bacterium]|nr:hypothetical protein [Chloroflexota bacterium]